MTAAAIFAAEAAKRAAERTTGLATRREAEDATYPRVLIPPWHHCVFRTRDRTFAGSGTAATAMRSALDEALAGGPRGDFR